MSRNVYSLWKKTFKSKKMSPFMFFFANFRCVDQQNDVGSNLFLPVSSGPPGSTWILTPLSITNFVWCAPPTTTDPTVTPSAGPETTSSGTTRAALRVKRSVWMATRRTQTTLRATIVRKVSKPFLCQYPLLYTNNGFCWTRRREHNFLSSTLSLCNNVRNLNPNPIEKSLFRDGKTIH